MKDEEPGHESKITPISGIGKTSAGVLLLSKRNDRLSCRAVLQPPARTCAEERHP